MTARTGLWQDSQDRTTGTGHPAQVNWTDRPGRSAVIGELDRRRVRARHDINARIAASGELLTRLLGKATGTGQPGQDS